MHECLHQGQRAACRRSITSCSQAQNSKCDPWPPIRGAAASAITSLSLHACRGLCEVEGSVAIEIISEFERCKTQVKLSLLNNLVASMWSPVPVAHALTRPLLGARAPYHLLGPDTCTAHPRPPPLTWFNWVKLHIDACL